MADVPDTVLALLRKIRALAERGVAGERETAQRQLDRRLDALGLTLDDLAVVERERRTFTYRTQRERELLVQIIAMVTGISGFTSWSTKGRRGMSVSVTVAEEAEVRDLFEYYRRAYKREEARLFTAFLYQHELFAPSGGDDEDEREPMDRDEGARLAALMSGLSEATRLRDRRLVSDRTEAGAPTEHAGSTRDPHISSGDGSCVRDTTPPLS